MVSPIAQQLEALFPRLRQEEYDITSPREDLYNCVAYAAEDFENFWWPIDGAYWPPGAPKVHSVAAFLAAFEAIGYAKCRSVLRSPGYKKVVLYVDVSGLPTHMARQLRCGRWASKIGRFVDIEHRNIRSVSGARYGQPKLVMRKRRNAKIGPIANVITVIQELVFRWSPPQTKR